MLSHDARAWFGALERAGVVLALEDVFAEAAREIESRGPACWASGRCCDFERAGHRLYVTGLEAAYTLSRLRLAASAERERLARERRRPLPVVGSPSTTSELALPALEAAVARGGCPFQAANLCAIHTIKPLGCRLFFCDRSATDWQRELHERLLRRVRDVHDEYGTPYAYGEWRAMLREALGA